MADTKIDLINSAYSRMRISGITKQPIDKEITLALRRLENMAYEFEGRNICVNYNFEDEPDPNSITNIPKKYWDAFETNLATRLLADFGKEINPALIASQQAGLSFLYSGTAQYRETQYPSRMPRGSGATLRWNRWQRFFRPQPQAPIGCATQKMIIGEINDYVEEFDQYLNDGEDIDTFTIDADTGLNIVSSSNTLTDVNYRLEAVGTSGGNYSNTYLRVTITVTTTDGREVIRQIAFELSDAGV